MSPLALLQALFVLLCCSPLALASSWELTLARAASACGDDQLVIFDASDGLLNLSVNGVLVQDRVLACQKLGFYSGSGCLRCSNLSDAWRGAVKQYCGEGSETSHATLHPDVPRKLLRRLTENSSRNDYGPCGMFGLNENNQDTGDSSEKQDHLLAVPGVILLCCGLMLPCFHAERKEVSRHDTTTVQRNAGQQGRTPISGSGEWAELQHRDARRGLAEREAKESKKMNSRRDASHSTKWTVSNWTSNTLHAWAEFGETK